MKGVDFCFLENKKTVVLNFTETNRRAENYDDKQFLIKGLSRLKNNGEISTERMEEILCQTLLEKEFPEIINPSKLLDPKIRMSLMFDFDNAKIIYPEIRMGYIKDKMPHAYLVDIRRGQSFYFFPFFRYLDEGISFVEYLAGNDWLDKQYLGYLKYIIKRLPLPDTYHPNVK